MKFVVSSSALFGSLQAISRVIIAKNALPILDCFLFEVDENQLTVTASDSETTMTTSLEISDVQEKGRIAVSAKTLLEALKVIPEQPLSFVVNMTTFETTIQYQNGKYSLMSQSADEFPQRIDLGQETKKIQIDTDILYSGINYCLFATADDELRPVMNGVYFDLTTENLTMVSSDGHKLVRSRTTSVKVDDPTAFILPKKPALLLKALLTKEAGVAVIEFNQRNAVITLERYQLICRLVEGRYPNYNSVIPTDNPHHVVVDRELMLGALRRVSIFSSIETGLVKLQFVENKINISAQDIDFSTSAEESIDCQFAGEELSIGFKAPFLIDILSNMTCDDVNIQLADPSRAGVIIPEQQEEGEDLLMLLMPIMISEY